MIHRMRIDTDDFLTMRKTYRTFVILPADRDYKIGDLLVYREFDGLDYTGREVKKEILYKEMNREGIKEGYVVLGIKNKIGRPRKEK